MKKIVVININKDYCFGCTQTTCSGTLYDFLSCCVEDKEYKKEQVPETFAELKTLFLDKLKELNVMWFGDKFVENKSEEFWVKGILFKADKTLSIRDDNDNIRVIMTNIDYPLMWLLIQTTLNIKSNPL